MAKKKKRGPGRPPKPKEKRSSRSINMKLTEAEYAALEKAANGFPVHTWARVTLLKKAGFDPKRRK
jgi:transposase